MRWSKLAFKDSLSKLEIGESLLISLKHIHTASKVIINCGCINSVSSKALLSNLSCLEIASQGPCWLIGVIQDRTKTAVRESLIWMIINKINFFASHVARHGNIIFATRFID
jgi:hypothetical protein